MATKTKEERDEYWGCDTPNAIRKCLTCQKSRCTNCLDSSSRQKYNTIYKRRVKEKKRNES